MDRLGKRTGLTGDKKEETLSKSTPEDSQEIAESLTLISHYLKYLVYVLAAIAGILLGTQ